MICLPFCGTTYSISVLPRLVVAQCHVEKHEPWTSRPSSPVYRKRGAEMGTAGCDTVRDRRSRSTFLHQGGAEGPSPPPHLGGIGGDLNQIFARVERLRQELLNLWERTRSTDTCRLVLGGQTESCRQVICRAQHPFRNVRAWVFELIGNSIPRGSK